MLEKTRVKASECIERAAFYSATESKSDTLACDNKVISQIVESAPKRVVERFKLGVKKLSTQILTGIDRQLGLGTRPALFTVTLFITYELGYNRLQELRDEWC